MTQVVTNTNGGNRLVVLLLEIFAILALLLVAIGIYGVIAFTVSQRTQETRIRLALGAHRRRILLMVLKNGMKLTAIWLLVGLPLSAAIPPLLQRVFQRSHRGTQSCCAAWRSCLRRASCNRLDLHAGTSCILGRSNRCPAL